MRDGQYGLDPTNILGASNKRVFANLAQSGQCKLMKHSLQETISRDNLDTRVEFCVPNLIFNLKCDVQFCIHFLGYAMSTVGGKIESLARYGE